MNIKPVLANMNLKDFQNSLRDSLKRFLVDEEEIERKYRVNNLDIVIHLQKSTLHPPSLISSYLRSNSLPKVSPHRIFVTCDSEDIRNAVKEIFVQKEKRFVFNQSLIEEEFEAIFRSPQETLTDTQKQEEPTKAPYRFGCKVL